MGVIVTKVDNSTRSSIATVRRMSVQPVVIKTCIEIFMRSVAYRVCSTSTAAVFKRFQLTTTGCVLCLLPRGLLTFHTGRTIYLPIVIMVSGVLIYVACYRWKLFLLKVRNRQKRITLNESISGTRQSTIS